MSFRLVPNSVTLDDLKLKQRNSPNLCVISPNSVAFRRDYVKVVGDTCTLSAAKMWSKKIKFLVIIYYGDIGSGSPLATALK